MTKDQERRMNYDYAELLHRKVQELAWILWDLDPDDRKDCAELHRRMQVVLKLWQSRPAILDELELRQ